VLGAFDRKAALSPRRACTYRTHTHTHTHTHTYWRTHALSLLRYSRFLCERSYEEWKKKTKGSIQTEGEEAGSAGAGSIALGEWRKPRFRYNNSDDAGGVDDGGAEDFDGGDEAPSKPARKAGKAGKAGAATGGKGAPKPRQVKPELRRPEEIRKARQLKEKNKIKQMSSDERRKVFSKKKASFQAKVASKLDRKGAPTKSRVMVV